MHTPDLKNRLIAEVAKAADLCMKPYLHSVSLESHLDNEIADENIDDLTFKIQCRDIEGERQPSMDIELEVYKSGNDINITSSFSSLLHTPILWQGKHSVWMDSDSGIQCQAPSNGQLFEALARKLRNIFKGSFF